MEISDLLLPSKLMCFPSTSTCRAAAGKLSISGNSWVVSCCSLSSSTEFIIEIRSIGLRVGIKVLHFTILVSGSPSVLLLYPLSFETDRHWHEPAKEFKEHERVTITRHFRV